MPDAGEGRVCGGSQVRHDRTVEVIEMYEAEHPDIDIEYEFYYFDDITKLNTLQQTQYLYQHYLPFIKAGYHNHGDYPVLLEMG